MARKGKKRLSIYIPESLYKSLIEMKDKYSLTTTAYVILALADRIRREKQWDEQK